MPEDQEQQIELSDEDIEILIAHLRSTSQPASTQELVDALRSQAAKS